MIPIDIFTIENVIKVVEAVFGLITFFWGLLVLRNLIDLQENYRSIGYPLFMLIMGTLVFVSGLSVFRIFF